MNKYKKLNHLLKTLDVDIISFIETQINPSILDKIYYISKKILAIDLFVSAINNSLNELINGNKLRFLLESIVNTIK